MYWQPLFFKPSLQVKGYSKNLKAYFSSYTLSVWFSCYTPTQQSHAAWHAWRGSSKPCIQMSFMGMSICISLLSLNRISWPCTHVMWLRHYPQGTQATPQELRKLFKQMASVKSDWPLKIQSNARFARSSPQVPGCVASSCRRVVVTKRRESLAKNHSIDSSLWPTKTM